MDGWSYDQVPFEGRAIPFSAPAALALTARIHGGPRPPLEGARVLELGSGDGANLLPLAFHHSDWTLVGVDASERATARADESARALGLTNVRFVHADVATYRPESEYDYVIAHGLYSWIDPERRAALHRIVQGALAPSGLAYISFNAMPGWGVRGRVRDVLTRWPTDLGGARARGAALLALLGEPQHAWSTLLRHELERVGTASDGYLAHEYLTAHNDAFWLGEVVRDFAEMDLCYVGDASFDRPEGFVEPALRQRVEAAIADPIGREEFIDLLLYRQLRAAVFARHDAAFEAPVGAALLDEARVASVVRARNDPFDPSPGAMEFFVGPRGSEVRVTAALAKMAMLILARDYPVGYRLGQLCTMAAETLASYGLSPEPDGRERLRTGLWQLYQHLEVELRLEAPPLRTTPSEKPIASALARHEAAHRPVLTTPLHTALPLEPVDRAIITRLDGTRSTGELAQELCACIEDGELELEGAPSGQARQRPLLEARIEHTLTTLGWWGLVR